MIGLVIQQCFNSCIAWVVCFGLSFCCPIYLETFTGPWTDNMFLCTSEFTVQLPSAALSHYQWGKVCQPLWLSYMPRSCFTDEVCYELRGALFHLHTLPLPCVWCRLILVLSVPKTFCLQALLPQTVIQPSEDCFWSVTQTFEDFSLL